MSAFDLIFLGTCACDFSPKLKNEFKDKFDPDARRASSVLLNGKFLIDCGPHCCSSLEIINKNFSEISDIFFTHFHSDHFNEENVRKIALSRKEPLRLWARADAEIPEIENTEIIRMEKETVYKYGGMKITALEANHDETAFPQWLLFEKNRKKFLYALDGAWYMLNTYNFLKNSRLSLLVCDATVGDYEGDYRMAEHNSIPMIRLMLPSLKTAGIVDGKTEIVLSHLAPSLHKSHKETEKISSEFGAKTAFDGMKITI